MTHLVFLAIVWASYGKPLASNEYRVGRLNALESPYLGTEIGKSSLRPFG
jgi:hypothetical protein